MNYDAYYSGRNPSTLLGPHGPGYNAVPPEYQKYQLGATTGIPNYGSGMAGGVSQPLAGSAFGGGPINGAALLGAQKQALQYGQPMVLKGQLPPSRYAGRNAGQPLPSDDQLPWWLKGRKQTDMSVNSGVTLAGGYGIPLMNNRRRLQRPMYGGGPYPVDGGYGGQPVYPRYGF
jgi:hypothetical protein